jgi:ankyrin repeat protein
MKKVSKFDPQAGAGEQATIHSIILAAKRGDFGVVRRLLETGVDINTVDSETGFSPLHIAAVTGQQELLDVLLEHNKEFGDLRFDLLAKEPQRTAWQLAMSHGQFDVGEQIDVQAHKARRSPPSKSPSP